MEAHEVVFKDIFAGAEKVEILGKLPSLLWGYIDVANKFIGNLESASGNYDDLSENVQKFLVVLTAAADHLENQELRGRFVEDAENLQKLISGAVPPTKFSELFLSNIRNLEPMAGPRRESPESILSVLDRELDKAERVKKGRSADIVMNVELLQEIKDFLAQEVIAEGISSVLIIDNAGTLIANIGDKIDLDAIGLAAVAAANFAATEQIARIIGETDFVLLFYKGHQESFHFSRIGPDYIIVTIFDNALSLGLLRLRIAEVSQVLEKKLPKREE